MTTDHIAAEFGIPREMAKRALEAHEETGRPLRDIVADLIAGVSGMSETKTTGIPASFGKYEIQSLLGRGGGGVVYKVLNPSLGRVEALKIIKDEGESEDHQRFEREARVLGRLQHPNIVPIYEIGTIDGRPFYTMEYVEGESVADVIKRMRALPPRAAMIVARDAARALAAAHKQGVIHRDVKPHNILVTPDRAARDSVRPDRDSTLALTAGVATQFRVLLTDFGLARVAGEKSLTQDTGIVVGTLMYMSPEQVNAERNRVNEKSDVYSLGATMYQMLTGRIPFDADNILALQIKITCDEPTPIRTLKPGISRDIETIVMKCLEKDQDRRYASARDLCADIERYLHGEVIRARPASFVSRAVKKLRRHVKAVAAALGALAATAVLVFFLAVLPAIRARQRDLDSLDAALADKRAKETRFAQLLAEGRYEDAVRFGEPYFGATPSLPDLKVSARASAAAYSDLRAPYRIALPAAYLGAGRARLQAKDAKGRADFASAYRASVAADDPATGREALRLLGESLEGESADGALAMYLLAESRFAPPSPGLLRALAQALERAGRLEEAANRWQRLEKDPDHGEEARRALAWLRPFLPRRVIPLSRAFTALAEWDDEPGAEFFAVTESGELTIYKLTATDMRELDRIQLGFRSTHWVIRTLDPDGDGRPEVIVSSGIPGERQGRIWILERGDRGVRIAGEDRSPKSFASEMVMGDVDGDGTKELFCAMAYFERAIRVYRYRDETLTFLGDFDTGCDPELLAFGPWGPSGERQMLLHLGPWFADRAFRLVLLSSGRGDWPKIAEGPDRFHAKTWMWTGENEALIAAFREARESGAMPDLLPGGLYRFTVRDGTISALDPVLGPWSDDHMPSLLARLDADHVVLAVENRMNVIPIRGGEARTFSMPGNPFYLLAGDVDGDRDNEIVFISNELLHVWGLGDPTEAIASAGSKARSASLGRRTAGDDMLEARLYVEAERIFDDEIRTGRGGARAYFGRGNARAGRTRFEDAIPDFREAARDPNLAVEAGLRWAYACECRRDWKGLLEAVEFLESTPGRDSYAEEQVRRLRTWVVPAAAMAPQVRLADWASDYALLSENPFEARIAPGGLQLWDNPDRPGTTGVSLFYDGGPMRLRMVVQFLETPPWETGVRAGMYLAAQLPSPRRYAHRIGPSLMFYYGGEGSSDRTIERNAVRMYDREGDEYRGALAQGRRLLETNRDYRLEFEYIPAIDRLFFWIGPLDGPAHEQTITVPFRLERGLYQVGGVREILETVGQPALGVTWLLKSIEMDAASTMTRLLRPPPANPGERLLLANGDLVRGRVQAALEGYEEVIRAQDPETLWRAHLFRSLVQLRRKDEAAARTDVAAAIRLNGTEVLRIARSATQALAAEEREFYRSFFRK